MKLQRELRSIIHRLAKDHPVVEAGRNHKLKIVSKFSDRQDEKATEELMAVSKALGKEHAIIAYNNSATDARLEVLALGNQYDHINKLKAIYGYECCSKLDVIHRPGDKRQDNYIQLYMQPKQLVILEAC